ncbi:hypothetical protein Tco_0482370 [Tanacetum coccineum]
MSFSILKMSNSILDTDVEYVEASPPNSEPVSSKVMEIVIPEVGRIEDDILLIKDDTLRETLLNVNQPSSGSPTTPSDLSLPDYEAFSNDHIEETSSGSTTTYSDSSFSKYDSFIFDLSINSYHPSNRSDFHEEFADELAQIISQPEYDCFFKDEPELGNFTMDVVGNIFQTREPRVHVRGDLFAHLELDIPSSDPFSIMLYGSFLHFFSFPLFPPYLHLNVG